MYALFLGFPVWWILGLSAFIWPIMAVPMAAYLFRRPNVYVPKGFAIWALFLAWVFGSSLQIRGFEAYVHFGYRASLYVSATIAMLYVANISREALPTARVVTIMSVFWMYVVLGGLAGMVAPTASFTSPVEMVMPGAFVSNEFVHDLVHPATAQVMDVLGYDHARPKAPFTYATNWGAAVGLLIPFVILGWTFSKSRTWRVVTAIAFLVAIVPVVSSLDRGLWLGLGAGLLYAAVRFAMAGRTKPLKGVVIVLVALAGMVYLTPLKMLVTERFENPHSNERRLSLYGESIDVVTRSPILGFGSPQPSENNPNAPPVGTQGQVWQVLVSQGIPGALLFAAWFLFRFWRMRHARDPVGFWCHVVVLIALVEAPFYDWLGAPLATVMIAIALAAREARLAPPPLEDVAPAPLARPLVAAAP